MQSHHIRSGKKVGSDVNEEATEGRDEKRRKKIAEAD